MVCLGDTATLIVPVEVKFARSLVPPTRSADTTLRMLGRGRKVRAGEMQRLSYFLFGLAVLCLVAWASPVTVGIYRGGLRYWCTAGINRGFLWVEVFLHARL